MTFASSRLGSGTGTFTGRVVHEHEHEHEHEHVLRTDAVPTHLFGSLGAAAPRVRAHQRHRQIVVSPVILVVEPRRAVDDDGDPVVDARGVDDALGLPVALVPGALDQVVIMLSEVRLLVIEC